MGSALQTQLSGWREELDLLAPVLQYESRPAIFRDAHFISGIPSLYKLAELESSVAEKLTAFDKLDASSADALWLEDFKKSVRHSSALANEKINGIQLLSSQCDEFANMEYNFSL